MSTTYRTQCWGDDFEVSADWAQASSPVDGPEGGRQVADFRHSPSAAMRALLEETAQYGGSDPDDDEVAAEIDEAVESMIEVGSAEDAEDQGYDSIGDDTGCYVRVRRFDGGDMVDWRIGAETADAHEVLARLIRGGLSVEEAITAMSDATRWSDGDIVRECNRRGSLVDRLYASDKWDAIYRIDGELVLTDGTKTLFGLDADECVAHAVEHWDGTEEDEVTEAIQ